MLLQVLRIRDAPVAPPHTRRGHRTAGSCAPAAHQRAAGPDGRGARPPRWCSHAAGRVGLRGLHRLRGVGLRAGTRAGDPAAHEPRRAGAGRPQATPGRHGIPGSHARVDPSGPGGAPGFADQASGCAARHDPRGRRAPDPFHERDPLRDRRVGRRPPRVTRGTRLGPCRVWAPAGDHPPELRAASSFPRRGACGHRFGSGRSVLAHRSPRRACGGCAGLVHAGDDRRREAADRGSATADAGRRHPGSAEPRRSLAGAGCRRRDGPRRAERERRPHLARAPVSLADPGTQAPGSRRHRADRATLCLPAVHRPGVDRPERPGCHQVRVLVVHPAAGVGAARRAAHPDRAGARRDRQGARWSMALTGRVDGALRRDPDRKRSRTCARRPTSCAPSWSATR